MFSITAYFPAGSFESESIDVRASFGVFSELSNVKVVSNIGSEAHLVEGLVGGTSSDLHNSSEERHGVEKSRQPEYHGGGELFGPSLKLSASQDQIFKPDKKTLLGEIGTCLPTRRNQVQCESVRKSLHGLSNVQGTLKTSIEIRKRALDFY